MVRVPPEETETLLDRRSRRAHGDGRPRDPRLGAGGDEGVRTKRQLQSWVDRGVEYAKSLPPK